MPSFKNLGISRIIRTCDQGGNHNGRRTRRNGVPGPRAKGGHGIRPGAEARHGERIPFEGDGISRASFAREKGIPPSTFDGWLWKYAGIERGHARESANGLPAAVKPRPIDVTD